MSIVTRRVAAAALLAAVLVTPVAAQESRAPAESLGPVVPLAGPATPASGGSLLTYQSAERALELGFPSAAIELYQALLSGAGVAGTAAGNELLLGLATAYLSDNRVAEAEQTLRRFYGPPTPPLRLRLALVAARQKRYDSVRAELSAMRVEDLPEAERGWFYFLEGVLADVANDFNRAGEWYQRAVDSAQSSLVRARFALAEQQSKMMLRNPTDAEIANLRQNIERYSGRSLGYRAVSDLAVALNARGERAAAVTLLQTQLQTLSREQKLVSDEWSLLLGLIAGPNDGTGRNALRNLITHGTDRDKQRVALQLLARGSAEPGRGAEFRAKLDELIGAASPHPLLEELLLFRAAHALTDRREGQANLARAETDATQLLERFPGTQYRALAFEILTNAAWERGQYRNAANLATRAREYLPPGELRSQAGVLVAEAYFRGNDFSSAAEAYRAALAELPAGVSAGDLMFQQILAEIRAGRLEPAAALLDERSRDPRFDAANRWQAEWNLTRALQAAGQTGAAYGRLNQLLNDPANAASIPTELAARMRWLQARLSFDAGEPRRTLALTEALLGSLGDLEEALRRDIASTTLLLQVQANFALNGDAPGEQATALLRRLRADFPGTDAAVYSYVVEADAAARQGRLVDAQNLLTSLAEGFPKSEYAPYALYQAARYAEQRAQPSNYREANNLIEDLVRRYPESDLVFYARLQQGHLLRKLTEFGRAQQVFADLNNNERFASHRGRAAAQLALADTHAAQAANDPSHLDASHRIYERLLDLPSAPPDLRAEAGYKYGLSLARRGQTENAIRIWGLVMGFLTQADRSPVAFGPEGRYWLARTLLEYGNLLRQQGRVGEAREAYDLVIRTNLPGAGMAQEAVARLQPAPAR